MTSQKGVLSIKYHIGRRRGLALRYRLARRTDEVLRSIKRYWRREIPSLLDIGTADGIMLDKLRREWNIEKPVGVDLSEELLRASSCDACCLVRADAAMLPFIDEAFDIVVATAVIEHVLNPDKMINECYRVLKEDGLCVVTTPSPLFERLATEIGQLENGQHVNAFDLAELVSLFERRGFAVVRTKRFMISPIGFPCELKIENVLRGAGFGFLLLNQLIVGRKAARSQETKRGS